ncbi:hypothetical protein [Endozoicomonas sp. 2B-B]
METAKCSRSGLEKPTSELNGYDHLNNDYSEAYCMRIEQCNSPEAEAILDEVIEDMAAGTEEETSADKINLKEWTAHPGHHKEFLHQPFNLNGRTVASNGHVAITVPLRANYCAAQSDGPVDDRILEHFSTLLEPVDHYVPLPEQITIPKHDECFYCQSFESGSKDCPECKGHGYVSFESDYNGYEAECKTCLGEGGFMAPAQGESCFYCHGSGKTYKEHHSVEFLGMRLNPNYFNLLNRLDEVEVSVNSDKQILKFKAKENDQVVYGTIMGKRR